MRHRTLGAPIGALLLLLSLLPSRLVAAEWEMLESDGEVFASIDVASLVRDGDVVKAWVRLTFSSQQRMSTGKLYQSLKLLTYFNCRLRLSTDKVIEAFDGPENLGPRVYAVSLSEEKLKWEEIAPETHAEQHLEFVCAKAPKQ